MACSLRVSNQFPSLGNELSVHAWTLRKLMLSYICGCLYTEFISQACNWKLQVNKECNTCALQSFMQCNYFLGVPKLKHTVITIV